MFIKPLILVFALGIAILSVVFFSIVPVSKENGEQMATENAGLTEETVPPPKQDVPSETITQEAREVRTSLQPVLLPPVVSAPQDVATDTQAPTEDSKAPMLPPLREEEILQAIVKIQCPAPDGLGKYIGSGFVLAGGTVVTAGHVLKDSGSETCEVIFPRERRPIYYLRGTAEDLKTIRKRHDEEGIDVAFLKLPALSSYPEARAIFDRYPEIQYPICADPKMVGDRLLHFGYPSNYADQTYLSSQEGQAVVHADIKGVEERLSSDQTYTFKSPIFAYTYDESGMHPYMVSQVASFYGDSGGLAFNATKQCIIGPHRGGTIGKAPGENFSVFMNLGWGKAK